MNAAIRSAWFPAVLLLACGGGSLTPVDATALDLNDVSFLYPLPTLAERTRLLGLEAQGNGGPLLTRALFDALPPLMPDTPGSIAFGDLRIVSARIDPCFPGSAPPAAPVCLAQLRLVAQPVLARPTLRSTSSMT